MKKVLTISLLTIYLFSTTELSQLLKLPLLIEHFTEHKEENRDVTLWQFLYMHYAMDNGKGTDNNKDKKLPFKSHDNFVSVISNIYTPLFSIVVIPKPTNIVEENTFKIADGFLLPSFLSNIWQPPRVS